MGYDQVHVALLASYTLDDVIYTALFDLARPKRVGNGLTAQGNDISLPRLDRRLPGLGINEIGGDHWKATGGHFEAVSPLCELILAIRSECRPRVFIAPLRNVEEICPRVATP